MLNNLFRHPYTKISIVQRDLNVTRLTATRYLEKLVAAGFLNKVRIGRSNYFINAPLVGLFINLPHSMRPTSIEPIESITDR